MVVLPRTQQIKSNQTHPAQTVIHFKQFFFFCFSSNSLTFCQILFAPLRLTRTPRSPPSCRLQIAGPESPLRTGRNWSGPPAVLGARSLWRCKWTRRRWTAGSRQSLQCPRPEPIESKTCRLELPGLSAVVEKWPDGTKEEFYYGLNVNILTLPLETHAFLLLVYPPNTNNSADISTADIWASRSINYRTAKITNTSFWSVTSFLKHGPT